MVAALPWPVVGELVTEGQTIVAIPVLEVAGDVFFSHLLGIKVKTRLARRFSRIGKVSQFSGHALRRRCKRRQTITTRFRAPQAKVVVMPILPKREVTVGGILGNRKYTGRAVLLEVGRTYPCLHRQLTRAFHRLNDLGRHLDRTNHRHAMNLERSLGTLDRLGVDDLQIKGRFHPGDVPDRGA